MSLSKELKVDAHTLPRSGNSFDPEGTEKTMELTEKSLYERIQRMKLFRDHV